jgi:hypothetical protein
MAGTARNSLGNEALLATLALWVLVPLSLSALAFSRREL